ncbi:hypothetical protein DL770_006575 [Monosporascus sp. CRB-9-2]|nr:hypothetical protein DL770_006575 [Monosporascus sp. CRB-9-2]
MNLNDPALDPPADRPDIIPNFDNPPNNNPLAWGVLSTCAAVATICVLLRFYGRVFLLRKVQMEEVMVFLAYGNFWGAAYSTFRMIETPGYFVHQWDLRYRDLIPTAYYVFIFGVCYCFVLALLKVAILVEWCRMFLPKGNRIKSPFYWGCLFVIFVQITAGVSVIFGLGLLACVSATFRLATTVAHGRNNDGTYTIGPLLFWATAEMACGFFIICIPCVPKILKDTGVIRNIKRAFGMKTNTNSSKQLEHYGTGSLSHGKMATTASSAYYKLDEDGLPLKNLKSESTENLHNNNSNAGIVLTTRITVNTQDTRSVSDTGSHDMHMNSKPGWAR